MEELLKSLGIDENTDAEVIVEKLELKQSEIMERLDNVEDEKRRQKLEGDLKKIAAAITAFSWMKGKKQTGIAREEDVMSDDFSDLKGQSTEKKKEPTLTERQSEKKEEKKKEKTKEELYDDALAVMATPNYMKGVEMMRKLAENGYAQASYKLGEMYSGGNRVEKNAGTAEEWYRKAAEQGNVDAQIRLGNMYYYGSGGVEVNYIKAAEWYRKAAEQGDADAQCNMGVMYEHGRGVTENYDKAVEWYRKAIRQGHSLAQSYLDNIRPKEQFYTETPAVTARAASTYTKSTTPASAHKKSTTSKYTRREIRLGGIGKFIVGLCILVGIVMTISIIGYHNSGSNACVELIWAYLPNVSYKKSVYVGSTNSPYYISLVPLDELMIDDSCDNLSVIINPYGAKKMDIYSAVKKIKIHDGTEHLYLNCGRLEELTIPDSVTSLQLENLKDEVALTLELPENLKSFEIRNSPYLTDAGFQALKIPESVQVLTIQDCSKMANIDILNIPDGVTTLELRNPNGNFDVTIPDSVTTLVVKNLEDKTASTLELPEHLEYLEICESYNLTGTGFQALKIPESVQELYISDCDSLTNIDIINDLEKLTICGEEGRGNVNIIGNIEHVSTSSIWSLEINGEVQHLSNYSTYDSVLKRLIVNGEVGILSTAVEDYVEFNKAPRALMLNYFGYNKLTIPEGTEILDLQIHNAESLELPNGLRYLKVSAHEGRLDLDTVNIPESVLYYHLSRRDDTREYQDENCPKELLEFDFSGEIPD